MFAKAILSLLFLSTFAVFFVSAAPLARRQLQFQDDLERRDVELWTELESLTRRDPEFADLLVRELLFSDELEARDDEFDGLYAREPLNMGLGHVKAAIHKAGQGIKKVGSSIKGAIKTATRGRPPSYHAGNTPTPSYHSSSPPPSYHRATGHH